MKKLALIAVMTLTSLYVSAQDVPDMDLQPGPMQNLSPAAVSALDALASAKPSDLATFAKAGNVMKSATVQKMGPMGPDAIIYTFIRQHCSLGGITGGQCIGGARLEVAIEYIRTGSMVTKKITSQVLLIK